MILKKKWGKVMNDFAIGNKDIKKEKQSRESIIQSLAEHMGMVDKFDTRYKKSRYDSATGTLYCEGIVLPHSSLEKIKDWHRHQMEMYRELSDIDGLKREYFLYYAVAYNAICLLEDNLDDLIEKK